MKHLKLLIITAILLLYCQPDLAQSNDGPKSFIAYHPFFSSSSRNSPENHCPPLPPPGGRIVTVSYVAALESAVNGSVSGDTILIADGTYNLDGVYLRLAVPHVTLRSASGNREAVILDGNYLTTEIIQIVASNMTIADLTLREADNHPIHVMSSDSAHTVNTLIYNVHIIDPGEQAIKINPAATGYYPDNGIIACSRIELTDTGRPHIRNNCYTGGIDAHQARGWVIHDNIIEGFWCAQGFSEHAIHLWRGCRDTTIERNLLLNNARGVGLGLETSGAGRTYPDNPCPGTVGYVDDFAGAIRNNFVFANRSDLFSSEFGFDCGICLWNACNARALHNTVVSTQTPFSSIEWRFPNTNAEIINNLVSHNLRERDGASATQADNLTNAPLSMFVDGAGGDLHLSSTATNAIDHAAPVSGVTDDYDGDVRPIGIAPDIGADEYGLPSPAAVTDLRVAYAITATNILTATLRWTAPQNAITATLRYSTTQISEASWGSAPVLTGTLPGDVSVYTATLPHSNEGHLYFTLKSQNAEGAWSALSNNAFWPYRFFYLPLVLHND